MSFGQTFASELANSSYSQDISYFYWTKILINPMIFAVLS